MVDMAALEQMEHWVMTLYTFLEPGIRRAQDLLGLIGVEELGFWLQC